MSRGVGVGLIIIGASSLLSLPIFQPEGLATSGWTSYSPLTTNSVASGGWTSSLQDTFYLTASTASFYWPSAAEVLAGVVMIWLSKPIGRLLTKGLRESDQENSRADGP